METPGVILSRKTPEECKHIEKTTQVVCRPMSILLVHEVVKEILRIADKEKLLSREGLEPRDIEHLQNVALELGENPDDLLALGVWCDGVPFN